MALSTIDTTNDDADVSLYVQCHCRAQTLRVRVKRSLFPLPAETCHCDDCRQITGLLANDFIMLRDALSDDIFDPDSLPRGMRAYTPGSVVWYWCEVCGCHMVQSSKRQGGASSDGSLTVEAAQQAGVSRHKWYISSGVVYPLHLPAELGGTRVFERQRHSWVRPGRDGCGLAKYMVDGLPRFASHDGDAKQLTAEQLQDDKASAEEQDAIRAAVAADSLPIQCRCGYVRLRLLRPKARTIHPDYTKYILDRSGQKYVGEICPCNSCRTTTGFEGGVGILFTAFTHVERDDADTGARPTPTGYDAATQLQGDAVDKPATVGLCVYASSDENRRRFCPCCGASIFIDFASDGAHICDVFLGVIRAPFRAIVSSWIQEGTKMVNLDYCRDRELAQALHKGWCPDIDCSLSKAEADDRNGYSGELVLPPDMVS